MSEADSVYTIADLQLMEGRSDIFIRAASARWYFAKIKQSGQEENAFIGDLYRLDTEELVLPGVMIYDGLGYQYHDRVMPGVAPSAAPASEYHEDDDAHLYADVIYEDDFGC